MPGRIDPMRCAGCHGDGRLRQCRRLRGDGHRSRQRLLDLRLPPTPRRHVRLAGEVGRQRVADAALPGGRGFPEHLADGGIVEPGYQLQQHRRPRRQRQAGDRGQQRRRPRAFRRAQLRRGQQQPPVLHRPVRHRTAARIAGEHPRHHRHRPRRGLGAAALDLGEQAGTPLHAAQEGGQRIGCGGCAQAHRGGKGTPWPARQENRFTSTGMHHDPRVHRIFPPLEQFARRNRFPTRMSIGGPRYRSSRDFPGMRRTIRGSPAVLPASGGDAASDAVARPLFERRAGLPACERRRAWRPVHDHHAP